MEEWKNKIKKERKLAHDNHQERFWSTPFGSFVRFNLICLFFFLVGTAEFVELFVPIGSARRVREIN